MFLNGFSRWRFIKQIVLLVGLFICGNENHAQTKWETTEATLKDSSDKAKIGFYLGASKGVFVSDRSASLAYAEKGYILAKGNEAYANEFADLNNMLGVIAMYNEQYAKADEFLQKALAISKQNSNETIQLKALSNLALNSSKKGNFQQSILLNLEIVPLLEKKNDWQNLANVYANISNAYFFQGLLSQSESYQQKALALFQKVNYNYGISNSLNTLCAIATNQKQYELARKYGEAALKVKKQLHDSTGIANTYNNLVDLYTKLHMEPQRLDALKQAESIYKSLHEEKNLANVYSNFGAYYTHAKNYRLANDYEQKALTLAKKTKDPYLLSAIYENLSVSQSHLENLDTALAYSKRALAEKDSLTNLQVSQQIADIETKYETEKKERIISNQKSELTQKKVQLQERQLALTKQRYMIVSLISLLLFLVLTGYLFYRKHKLQQQQRLQKALYQEREKAATTVIVAEEKERKRIAQDLHDGVGQMLSAIKMNLTAYEESLPVISNTTQSKLSLIISLVDDSCKEVRSVSHNMMPNALLKKSLALAVREFIDKLDDKALKIHLYTEGLDEPLNINIETVLYRVIQESINNVIKHSEADTVDIAIIKDNSEITATIEDNGKGFHPDKLSGKGLGIGNMKTRIEYLHGKMTIDSTEGSGTVIAVVVPLQSPILS